MDIDRVRALCQELTTISTALSQRCDELRAENVRLRDENEKLRIDVAFFDKRLINIPSDNQ